MVSAQHLIGSTITEFCISSVLWVLGGSVLSMTLYWLSFYQIDHSMLWLTVVGELVNVVSGVPQGSVLVPLLFLLYTSELFFILENKLISYADDSTLIAVVPSPGIRVPWAVTSWRLVSGVTFGGWNWMRVRLW